MSGRHSAGIEVWDDESRFGKPPCGRFWTPRPGTGMKRQTCGGLAMKIFFLRFFTWWNGQTFGTQLWTWLYGELVGQDEFGNRYYRTKGGKIDPVLLMERRWVIYNGEAEASAVPPS